MMAFFGVVGSKSIGDINPVNPAPIECFGAGDGVKGDPRTGSVVSRDERQARLFWRSRGGGRRETSVSVLEGLKRVREGERRDPNDSSLEVGDDGLCGGRWGCQYAARADLGVEGYSPILGHLESSSITVPFHIDKIEPPSKRTARHGRREEQVGFILL